MCEKKRKEKKKWITPCQGYHFFVSADKFVERLVGTSDLRKDFRQENSTVERRKTLLLSPPETFFMYRRNNYQRSTGCDLQYLKDSWVCSSRWQLNAPRAYCLGNPQVKTLSWFGLHIFFMRFEVADRMVRSYALLRLPAHLNERAIDRVVEVHPIALFGHDFTFLKSFSFFFLLRRK